MKGASDRVGACCCTSWMACIRKSREGLRPAGTQHPSYFQETMPYRLLADQQKVCMQALHSLSPLRRVLQEIQDSRRPMLPHSWLRRVLQ